MNLDVRISLLDLSCSSFGFILKKGIAGSFGNSIFNFLGTAILFSTVAVPSYIPTNRAQEFQVLHILTNNCYFLFIKNSSHRVTAAMKFKDAFFLEGKQ